MAEEPDAATRGKALAARVDEFAQTDWHALVDGRRLFDRTALTPFRVIPHDRGHGR